MKAVKTITASIGFLMFASPVVFGTGIPVIDFANVTQSTISAIQNAKTAANSALQYAKQIDQYNMQQNQYADQVKNTIAPVASVWQEAQRTINDVLSTVDAYKSIGSDLQGYLNKFQDVNYWSTAPSGLFQPQTAGSSAQKKANEALMRGILQQQEQLRQDAASLQQLQGLAQNAEGRMQALQYANQLASLQAKQLMQVRALLMQTQAAEAARNQTLANEEAMRQAATDKFLGGQYQYGPSKAWKP